MAEASLAITTEYVKCFLALIGKDISWPEVVRHRLAEEDLDPLDVTHVMTHGDAVESEKETAYGTTIVMIGYTCDDVRIRVKFWADMNQLSLRILDVARI